MPGLAEKVPDVTAALHAKLEEHRAFVRERGEDLPEIQNWRWARSS
nr:hypothetical protein [Rhizobium phaseoli]